MRESLYCNGAPCFLANGKYLPNYMFSQITLILRLLLYKGVCSEVEDVVITQKNDASEAEFIAKCFRVL